MKNNIQGNVVVITGASSGLGEATARNKTLMKCPAICRMMWTRMRSCSSPHARNCKEAF